MPFDRTNRNPLSRWWWSLDQPLVASVVTLIIVGFILLWAGSPPVAERLELDATYFILKQVQFLPVTLLILLILPLLPMRWLWPIAAGGLCVTALAMVAVLLWGPEYKGATRWLPVLGMSFQPSEIMKPLFVVTAAGILAGRPRWKGWGLVTFLYAIFIGLLILQPDMGMSMMLTALWGGLLFISGLPWLLVAMVGGFGVFAGFLGYTFLPHVQHRVDTFLGSTGEEAYQVQRAMEAFAAGGATGVGIAEGEVKNFLPDAHTDFIFAVVGEEFGMVGCLLLIGLIAFIFYRGLHDVRQRPSPFVFYAGAGLLLQFVLQAVINIAVNLHLMPTKGMTLPFVSYGGSSMLGVALGFGFLLALLRKRYGHYRHSDWNNAWESM